MNYLSVFEIAKKWNISARSVRNYCADGRIDGAFITGKTWNIPENAEKPERKNKKSNEPQTLLERLKAEKASVLPGGIYHKVQIELTYNSNHIKKSRSRQMRHSPQKKKRIGLDMMRWKHTDR